MLNQGLAAGIDWNSLKGGSQKFPLAGQIKLLEKAGKER